MKCVSISVFLFILSTCFLSAQNTNDTREKWISYMDKVARPVIYNLANDSLKILMPVELSERIDNAESRKKVAYLEAFARTMSGISPWLNIEGGSEHEIALRNQYRKWTIKAIENAVNPKANDYLLWEGYQPLVDASFFALALVRCSWIWQNLNEEAKKNVINALNASQNIIPVYSNWILFPAMIEAFYCKNDLQYDPVRIEYAIRMFSREWYLGDGIFSDGEHFAMDYYNSYVIHPYLSNIMESVSGKVRSFNWFLPKLENINKRYAEIQERTINIDGTYPAYGRSIVYRGGAFHHLADMSLRHKLPENLKPSQVRGALTAVIDKTINAPGTFTKDGWLKIGLHGTQPGLADFYITTGSLYLCSEIFLPLGLPADDAFWSDPDISWTSKKIWEGFDTPADHGLKE